MLAIALATGWAIGAGSAVAYRVYQIRKACKEHDEYIERLIAEEEKYEAWRKRYNRACARARREGYKEPSELDVPYSYKTLECVHCGKTCRGEEDVTNPGVYHPREGWYVGEYEDGETFVVCPKASCANEVFAD